MPPAETTAARPSRRGIVRGVAWAVPTAAIGVAVPAIAASSPLCSPTAPPQNAAPAFTSSFAGWTKGTASNYLATAGTPSTPGSDPIQFSTSRGATGTDAITDTFFVTNDPAANRTATVSLTTTALTCVAAGTYLSYYQISYHGGNARTMTLTGEVIDETGTVLGSRTFTAAGRTPNGNSNEVFQFQIARATRVRYRFTWTMPAAAGTSGNDIFVGRPALIRTGA